jgi:hypothetical protein
MQKIDTSAMMRELTEHETTLVSGGFGDGSFNYGLPDSAILTGFSTDEIRSGEISFDSTTNELVTTLYFSREDDSSDIRGADRNSNGEYGGRANSGQTVTRQTVTEGAQLGIGTTSVTIGLAGRNITFTLPTFVYTGPRTITTIQRTTVNGQPLPAPPPVDGCNDRGGRGGGGCTRPK